jgi:hypothetical protein
VLFDTFEMLLADLRAEGVEAGTAVLPVPRAVSHDGFRILRPGLPEQVIPPKRAERAPAVLITATGIPGEIHAHLSKNETGHERLIVSLIEPEGLHSTGHDSAELSNGKRGLRYQLVTTDDADEAVNSIRGWLHEMRLANPTEPVDRSAELKAMHRERQAWAARLLQGAPDLRSRTQNELCALFGIELQQEVAAASPASELTNVSPIDLVWNFPRGKRGKIGKAQVLLAPLELRQHDNRRHTRWLTASVNAAGRILIGTKSFAFADENVHRWDEARWLWDLRARETTPNQQWHLDVKRFLADETDPARQSIRLIKQRAYDEAFAMAGVDLSDEVKRLASGRRLGFQRSEPGGWSQALAAVLERCASWLIGGRAAEFVTRHYGTRFAKIAALPGQGQIRRASLVLAVPKATRPRLEIRWTGTPNRLPDVAWTRPAELDLMLLGVSLKQLLAPGRV